MKSFVFHGISGLCDKFSENESIIDSLTKICIRKDNLGDKPSQNPWKTDFISSGNSPNTPGLLTLKNVKGERKTSKDEVEGSLMPI